MSQAGGIRLSEKDFKSSLKERLAKYKILKLFLVVEEIPRNAIGKVPTNKAT